MQIIYIKRYRQPTEVHKVYFVFFVFFMVDYLQDAEPFSMNILLHKFR
jgi:hypothetical protein